RLGRISGRSFSFCSPRPGFRSCAFVARSIDSTCERLAAVTDCAGHFPVRATLLPGPCRMTAGSGGATFGCSWGSERYAMAGLSLILQGMLAGILVLLAVLSAQLTALALIRIFQPAPRVRCPRLPEEALPP